MGYGNGRGKNKLRLKSDVAYLSKKKKVLGVLGTVIDTGLTAKEEYDNNSDRGTGERVGRTVISTAGKVGGAAAGGTIGGSLCGPTIVLVGVCGTLGAWGGSKLGGLVSNGINKLLFD